MGWTSNDRRRKKRALYAKYTRAIEQNIDLSEAVFRANQRIDTITEDELDELDKVLKSQSASNSELSALRAEIMVLGGPEIGGLATRLNTAAYDYTGDGSCGQLHEAMVYLTYAMNADINLSDPFRKETIKLFVKKATNN